MNADQLAVVTTSAPWNIVLAGPGSGKSRVIVERAQTLKAAGIDPLAMAFVTFTNIGAKVLRRRLKESVGQVGFVGTLHGMMMLLIRRDDPRWVLIGEDDANEFLARHAKVMGFRGSDSELQAARSLDEFSDYMSPALRAVRAYRLFMRSEQMLDFDMVLQEGLRVIESLRFQNPWTHWFGDEFQDSGPVDARIYLSANPKELMLVGDPDQSIFAFRGARPANVTDFWNDSRFARHVLSQNYRCASSICEAANAVASLNTDRIAKNTESAIQLEGEVKTSIFPNDTEEQAAVTQLVSQHIGSGIAPQEIAVLCRTNKLANQIRDSFRDAGLPIAEVESEKRPKDWPLLILILTLISTPHSWAVARLLARLQAKFQKADQNAAEDAVIHQRKAGATPSALWSFPSPKVILSINADFSRFGVSKASHALMAERIRLYRPETVEELIQALRETPETKSTTGINVLTVHAAKGEEWDAVVLPGAELYHRKSDVERAEERRLMFVALTRARRSVIVTAANERKSTLPSGQSIVQRNPAGELFSTIAEVAEAHCSA